MTAGLSSTSFREIAIAARNSASASTDLLVCASREPRLLWEPARILRNPVSAGLSSASFCRSASALRRSASASTGFPVCNSSMPMRSIVFASSLRASFVAPGAAASAS